MQDEEKILPANGIYAVSAAIVAPDQQHLPAHTMQGMMSVGFRPTVDGKKRVIEVNLFNFNENIYDQHLLVFVEKYLREEIKFNSLPELIAQIDQDKRDTLDFFQQKA